MNFSRQYEVYRKQVEKKLEKVFPARKPEGLYGPADYILSGSGKRLRPVLVLAACDAVGGKPEKCVNAAAAVEMLHNFTLVHDDIMDNADTRRGMETLHKKHDISTAILVGDSLLAVAYEYLLKDCTGGNISAVSSFTKGLIEVCEGQSLDKEFEKRKEVLLKEYILMITKKTAAMMQMCCELGGYLGKAKPVHIKGLSDYGKNLGIAFQIQDDLIDLTGDENRTGKKVGGDLVEGKKTFLFLTALGNAKGKDLQMLKRYIQNAGIPEAEIPVYREIFERNGAIDASRRAIRRYSDKALESLSFIKSREMKDFFISLTNSLVAREK